VSFDPQNPRGAPAPTGSQPPRYVPPQPVRGGPSQRLLVAGLVIALVILAIVVVLVISLANGPTGGAPATRTPQPPGPTAAEGTNQPGPTPTLTTGSPTATTAATPGAPPPSAGTPEALLLAHIPEGLRATCTTATAASSPGIEMANCTANAGAITVNYSEYASADLMNGAYQEEFANAQIDANSGSCEDHSTWPAEGTYDVEGQSVGRRLCIDEQGQPSISWTDDRLNILAHATTAGTDAAALVGFWATQAGPIQ
jgi:hypothetical protein